MSIIALGFCHYTQLFGTPLMTQTAQSEYERNQSFNAIVRWLHSFRYKHIVDIFRKLPSRGIENPVSVLEIGCAHAKLYGVLNEQFQIDYCGVDIRDSLLSIARGRYGQNDNFRVVVGSATSREVLAGHGQPDVVIALETLEHIPEHDVVRIIESIAQLRPRLFVCSVPIEVGPAIWLKNVGSFLTGYSRHREYSWRETFWSGLYKLDKFPPHRTSHKGFDWRWLAQTIRHNMAIKETRLFPLPFLPAGLSTTVFFVAAPRP